ncbi:NAD(P)H-binding protein [Pseudomonas sp. JS3066]|uniref:NAD(P)H-binding protein n=1 Tax=unclassified Pseudomonas TaxID=196821 RepID=UPI000EA901CF|nr:MULTISPECIES: NAD(P)H-binding protein [unclassified Pseudomonas]AYF86741.1 NADH-flavin reductase [Pseudomonas sp. DY-1]MDH4653643.1 NADH-flavin reductase [Pseudomonas sp. BN606]MRK22010.1 NADH-flavin reductase [Pseudomonas sp. JG-B]WVK95788.1 NAD(P)H-binding protein [Pseudomonas sp. JS3066]
MKNLETPAVKLALYGAQSALGYALMAEALHRQYEVGAVISDLNAISARPGLRTLTGNAHDALSVSRTVVGKSAVIGMPCASGPPLTAQDGSGHDFPQVYSAVSALIDGLRIAGVQRLIVIDPLKWLEQSPSCPAPAAEYLQRRLLDSGLEWTLVEAPEGFDCDLEFDDFIRVPAENKAQSVLALQRFAMAVLDELMLCNHLHQRISVDGGD